MRYAHRLEAQRKRNEAMHESLLRCVKPVGLRTKQAVKRPNHQTSSNLWLDDQTTKQWIPKSRRVEK
eukprot:2138727-Amphidinium_carterae.1